MATRQIEILEDEDWKLFKEDGDEDARARLAEKYLPLVKRVIDRIIYRLPDFLDREDLISEGILGLIDAIDKFDPAKMDRFEPYALVRIRGSVIDSLRQMDWIPRSLRQKSREIENAIMTVEREKGAGATDEEVARHLGITVEDLQHTVTEVSGAVLFSFEELLQMSDDDKPLPFMNRVKDTSVLDPSDTVMRREIRDILLSAVEKLSDNEKTVVGLYYVESLTLKQIGEILGVTESRACQIHAKAVMRIKARMLETDNEIAYDM